MSELLNDLSLTDLTAPIDGASGEDLSFSPLFDQIKEARRADPDYLTQGDWQTDLKSSDWDLAITLAAQGLAQQSKDLMLVAWLSEGLARQFHFKGITFGLTLAEHILNTFWDNLFPSMEDGLEERTARLSLLNTLLADVVGTLPITQGTPFGLVQYDESRQVANLALQDPKAMQIALEEGKISMEIFQRSVVQTESDHLLLKATEIAESVKAAQQLQTTIDTLFGRDAPNSSALINILNRAAQLTEKLLKDRGVERPPSPAEADRKIAVAPRMESVPIPPQPATASASLRTIPLNRDEAFSQLAGVAQFFKQTEPQSPVPYLIERAIKWGNMPLEGWLNDVIKDSAVVDGIRDVLGTKQTKP